jgi:hypothetical protein
MDTCKFCIIHNVAIAQLEKYVMINMTPKKILIAQIKLIFLFPEFSMRRKILDERYSKIIVGITIKLIKTIEI